MLKRKMLDKLIAWKQKAGGREALLIEGVAVWAKAPLSRNSAALSTSHIFSSISHVCRAMFATSSKTSVMT